MKVSISFLISNLSNSGGTQRMLTVLCNELIEFYTITIFVHQDGASFFELDSRVIVAPLNGNLLQKNIQIYKNLKINKTAYYINLDSNSVMLNGFLLPSHTKLIVWEHYSLENNFKKLLFSLSRFYASYRAEKMVVLSEIEKKLWVNKYLTQPKKIEVIYNPPTFKVINKEKFNRFANKTALAVGNNIKVKGFDILLKAWCEIHIEAHLFIVGLSKTQIDELEKRVDELHLKNVKLFSKTLDIKAFYVQASLFVLSSRKEATPLVLIESQSLGLPVIAFNHLASVKEIAEDTVLYANFRQEETDLAQKMNDLLDKEDNYNEYYTRSLKNSEKFSIESFNANWKKILK